MDAIIARETSRTPCLLGFRAFAFAFECRHDISDMTPTLPMETLSRKNRKTKVIGKPASCQEDIKISRVKWGRVRRYLKYHGTGLPLPVLIPSIFFHLPHVTAYSQRVNTLLASVSTCR